jgi:hypothetical protein
MTIDKPGIYTIPEAEYHADPCPTPSASASLLATLIDKSPRHAWYQHPRLNPDHEAEHKTAFDFGSAVHALLLEGDAGVTVLDFPDFRTNAAKEARDAAYEAGRTPILQKDWVDVERMVAATRTQLAQHAEFPNIEADHTFERTLVWREGDVWCRARVDILPDLGTTDILADFKTTSGSAHPDQVTRRLYETGADIQNAWYRRGAKVLGYKSPRFQYVMQERDAPYALSIVEFDNQAQELADHRCDEAFRLYCECLASGRWPGYPAYTAVIEAPAWYGYRWGDYLARKGDAEERGTDINKLAMDWQAPLEKSA